MFQKNITWWLPVRCCFLIYPLTMQSKAKLKTDFKRKLFLTHWRHSRLPFWTWPQDSPLSFRSSLIKPMHLRKQIFWTPLSGVFKTGCFSLWYAWNLFLENLGIGGLAPGVYEKCPPYNFFKKILFAESVIEAQFTVFQVELLYLNKLPPGSLLACYESSEFW